MRFIKLLDPVKNRKTGLYECPVCFDLVPLRVDTVNSHSKRYDYPKVCKACANKAAGIKRKKHGDCYSRLYSTWKNIKDRALNPNNPKAYLYFGKGIEEDWLDYNKFKVWAMSNGYEETLTIDRIDSTLGYYASNCQWITLAENSGKDGRRDSYGKNKTIKISPSEVLDIIKLRETGLTHKSIADHYNVARTTITAILKDSQSSETIPNGSTAQAYGAGSGVNDE